jgi:glutamyl endopeptidase
MSMFARNRTRRLPWLMAFMSLSIALMIVAVPAHAQPTTPSSQNPNAIVSNDGFVPSVGIVATALAKPYDLPWSGTGLSKDNVPIAEAVPNALLHPAGSGLAPSSVIGADGRLRIYATSTYPYSAIAQIVSSIGICTGWLIGSDTLVTAGHCVYLSSWATNVRVYPGRNGNVLPFGSCGARRLYSVAAWVSQKNPAYDYGAIKLNCTIGNTTGWFGYRYQEGSMTGQASYIAGYPADKAVGTMWRHNDIVRATYPRRLFYANDTYGGQSGAPVWNPGGNCAPCGIAIHAYGSGGSAYNSGTRITLDVFNNLKAWKNS